jgi:hypothetical protein
MATHTTDHGPPRGRHAPRATRHATRHAPRGAPSTPAARSPLPLLLLAAAALRPRSECFALQSPRPWPLAPGGWCLVGLVGCGLAGASPSPAPRVGSGNEVERSYELSAIWSSNQVPATWSQRVAPGSG